MKPLTALLGAGVVVLALAGCGRNHLTMSQEQLRETKTWDEYGILPKDMAFALDVYSRTGEWLGSNITASPESFPREYGLIIDSPARDQAIQEQK